jgi:hypothetical protein
MTLRTVVVKIPRNMIGVCRLLEIRLVTLIAILIHKLVVTTYMARLTLLRHMCTC